MPNNSITSLFVYTGLNSLTEKLLFVTILTVFPIQSYRSYKWTTLQLYVHQFDSAYLTTLSIQTSFHQGRCTNPLPEKA